MINIKSKDNLLTSSTEYCNSVDDLKQSKDRLIEEKTKQIKEIENKYKDSIIELDESIKQTEETTKEYSNLLSIVSTFNEELIARGIIYISKLVKDIDFTYKRMVCTRKIKNCMNNDYKDIPYNIGILIADNKFLKDTLNEEELEELINNKNAILLSINHIYNNQIEDITLYNIEKDKLVCSVNFTYFEYVKDFINYILNYRYQNNIVDFNENDLIICLREYIKKPLYNDHSRRI